MVEMTARGALQAFDQSFWLSQNARMVDIIGDYAGQELFVLDGDALIQLVLDDPLLGLGKEAPSTSSTSSTTIVAVSTAGKAATVCPAFQLAHAKWSLEKALLRLVERDAVFDVVFWECNKANTTLPFASPFVHQSRSLARTLLIEHMHEHLSVRAHKARNAKKAVLGDVAPPEGAEDFVGLEVLHFEDLEDEAWKRYSLAKRPMFVMGSDGGVPSEVPSSLNEDAELRRILRQRAFLYDVMKQDIAVALLQAAEFMDTKIWTYVYTTSRKSREYQLESGVMIAVEAARREVPREEGSVAASTEEGSAASDLALQRYIATRLGQETIEMVNVDKALVLAYLVHQHLLESQPLSVRVGGHVKMPKKMLDHLRTTFLPSIFANLDAQARRTLVEGPYSKIDVDGSLFARTIMTATSSSSEMNLEEEVELVRKRAQSICGGDLPDFAYLAEWMGEVPKVKTKEIANTGEEARRGLLPFKQPLFSKLLHDVEVETEDIWEDVDESPETYLDDKHWHVNRSLDNRIKVDQSLSPWERVRAERRRLKKEQRFMASIQKSAASLTGAGGAILTPTIIASVRSSGGAKKKEEKVVQAHASKSTKEKPMTKVEKMRAEIQAEKSGSAAVSNTGWWQERLQEIEALKDFSSQTDMISRHLRNIRTKDDGQLWVEMRLKRLDVELRKWIADPDQAQPAVQDGYRAFLATSSNELLQGHVSGKKPLNSAQGKKVLQVLQVIGLEVLIPKGIVFAEKGRQTAEPDKSKTKPKKGDKKAAAATAEPAAKEALTFRFKTIQKGGEAVYAFMGSAEDPFEFQLRCMGDSMERSLDSKADRRVTFEPDAWQIDVLDLIDRYDSALVIAPTSSGKTFISFAAMEKVLRTSDDGIIIYVCPSKALVNQVAAEVYARFKKSVDGVTTWAMHTRDYRINDPQKCNILVTVPHILSIMLMSPTLAAKWVPRIKYVIVDEIHSIGEEGGGIWEQVLLLNPAPVIGLSATIGAPEKFAGWLESVEKSRGKTFHLIHHTHRYNALRKFVFAPRTLANDIGPKGTSLPQASKGIVHFHPYAALALGGHEIPSDLSLEPRDCLQLYKLMSEVGGAALATLAPAKFFTESGFRDAKPAIRIQQNIEYEKRLRTELLGWRDSKDVTDRERYRTVIAHLEREVSDAFSNSQVSLASSGPGGDFEAGVLPLLTELDQKNELPAILFNFDRTGCEAMLKRCVEDLAANESRWKDESPIWKSRVEKAKQSAKQEMARFREMERSKKAKKDGDEERMDSGGAQVTAFDEDAPAPEFSFLNPKASPAELAEALEELSWNDAVPLWARDALRRGVAVHHAGMNRRYRITVEHLFRRGVIRVIFATGTLALGINAPAKTAVLAGDSIFLTALNYRQCAGRAGRRGFDLRGNVVFYGIEWHKIQRLLISRVPRLGGSFPMTATMVLRLHSLLHGSGSAQSSVQSVTSMLSLPQLTVGSSTRKDELHHFVRFSIEYLRRAGLLDGQGRPQLLYGLAAHLYPYDPSNLCLVHLMRSGELHRLVRRYDESEKEATRIKDEMVRILAFLFARVYRRTRTAETIKAIQVRSPSTIVLESPPEEILESLRQHDRQIVDTFTEYATTYATQYADKLGPDNKLPLSGAVIGAEIATGKMNTTTNTPGVVARSAFVATSGQTDRFTSATEIGETARSGVHLNAHAVPTLGFLTAASPRDGEGEREQQQHQLDAYAYDFWKHGQLQALVDGNGLRKGDVWFKIQDFQMAIAAIHTALVPLQDPRKVTNASNGVADSDDEDDARDLATEQADTAALSTDGMEDSDIEEGGAGGKQSTRGVRHRIADGYGEEDDWRLYRVFAAIDQEYQVKFKAVFA